MSNVALFNGAAVPAFVKQAGLSETAKALAGGGATGKRVSIKGGVFRLMVDGKEVTAIDERYLDVVIVNAAPKIGRTFYMAQYDPENPAPPDCWSADGEKPDATAASPQATSCAACPQNAKGSGQGESRACRYSQRIALTLASDIDGDVMQLQVPATSIFGAAEGDKHPLQSYARWLAAQNISPETVITRMRFDTASESPKLFFKPMRWLSDEEYALAKTQGASPDALKAITMTVAQVDKVAAAPVALAGQRPAAPAAAAPEPAAAPADDEDPPAPPPPRRGRPPGSTKAAAAAAAASAAPVGAVSKPAPAKAAAAAAPAPMPDDEPAPPVVKTAAKPAISPATQANLANIAANWDDED